MSNSFARHLIRLASAHTLSSESFTSPLALPQERTAAYIDKLGRDLVKLVCDGEGVLAGVADLSLLKFRERDALEMAFKTWGVKVPYDGASVR